ncbi:hypothetical protein CANINC_001228 [Pichia inconspicua]|uniref:BRCT domain-containing protein n=1 Tax=Pichia inconspicua TaxID=52247 RepID=A0A4T0X458_9ASCO|nr:hypothetical protein CANINC_001228 [[Candida] inconspicua]
MTQPTHLRKQSSILFEGFTFTTTNISADEKAKIAEMISHMGGKLHSNLTSDTDILILGSTDTAKSKFCLERRTDVTLIYPNDFCDIYRRFKERDMPRIPIQILDEYPWPIFENCLLCVSRLGNVQNVCYEKNYINKLIHRFGGKPTSTLTPKVSYLITDKCEGLRYERAVEWNIVAVHPMWVIDSCNCQRIVNPKFYDISKIKDVTELGRGAYMKHRNVVDYGRKEDNPVYEELLKEMGTVATHGTRRNEQAGLFAGCIFSYYGFNETQVEKLLKVLKENGAEVQEEYDMTITHVLVPSSMTMDEVPEKIQRLNSVCDSKIVNEWFVERCLFFQRLTTDSWSLPPQKLGLNYDFTIHITGFNEIESLHLSKMIANLNFTPSVNLTKNCDFLVTNLASLGLTEENSPQLFNYKFKDILIGKTRSLSTSTISLTKKKINSAKKWNIPVVSIAFIWEFAQTGVLPTVIDPQWCIFAPKSLRPATNFLEYARSITGGTFHSQRADTISPVASPTKLPAIIPSPRKNSQKKWPKLVGTASDSQLKSAGLDDEYDYDYKSARRLNFNDDKDDDETGSKRVRGRPRRLIAEVEDTDEYGLGFDDLPVFKKRK